MAKYDQNKRPLMSTEAKEEMVQQIRPIHQQSSTFSGSTLHFNQFCTVQLHYDSLLKLMFIFQQSLPNMKANQIYSYVFSNCNEKLLFLCKGQLEGGLCFSTIQNRYSKIQLFAIKKEKRLQGCGSLLMNAYKHLLQIRKINLIVTHADNNSLEFYYKQGFSEQQYISSHIWVQKNQQFSFSTKLQCLVYPNINYFILKEKLKNQKLFIENKLKPAYFSENMSYQVKILGSNQPYCYKQGNNQEYFVINPFEIPGIIESGWTQNQYKKQRQLKQTKNYRQFGFIFTKLYKTAQRELRKMDETLKKSEQIIFSEPIDLYFIHQKLKLQKYENQVQFFDQIDQLFRNAMELYSAHQRITENLNELKKIVSQHKQSLAQPKISQTGK